MRVLSVTIAAVWSLVAWSQNDMIANINLQFQLANPGARALAMGGAFVGLADDATAIFSNPAGVARLQRDLLTLELASVDRNNEIPFYGGTIRQVGLQDFDFDLQSRDFPQSTASIPFAAYVRTANRLKWGIYYAEQAQFKRNFNTESIYLPHEADDDRPVNDFTDFYFFPSNNRMELDIRSLGLSAGIAVSERWSVGLTLAYSDFDYRGNTDLIIPDIFPAGHPIEGFVGRDFATIDVSGSDDTLSGNLGILFTPNESFSLGLAYRYYGSFDYDYRVEVLDFSSDTYQIDDQGIAAFNTPDSFGAGFAVKPNEFTVVALEVNRVSYSELSDDYHAFFDSGGETQTVSDATEYRVGVEWFASQLSWPLAIRAGYWFEPYHALTNTYLDNQILYADEDGFQHIRNAVFLRQFKDDTDHLSFGLGLTLSRHLAIDSAIDWSDILTTYSLSGVYRF